MPKSKFKVMEVISAWTGEIMDARLDVETYAEKNRMAILTEAYDTEMCAWLPFQNLTVNLPNEPLSNENCAFVDVSNFDGALDFIKKYKLGKPTGMMGFSGWCAYPEVEFDMDVVKSYQHVVNSYQQRDR